MLCIALIYKTLTNRRYDAIIELIGWDLFDYFSPKIYASQKKARADLCGRMEITMKRLLACLLMLAMLASAAFGGLVIVAILGAAIVFKKK